MPSAPDGLAALLARPIAHRGLHGGGALENTVAAAHAAIAHDYGIECDVVFARDGTPMVFHDATLDRLAGRPEAIAGLSPAAIAAVVLDGGAAIPTLAAFLKAIAGRVALVVEIKPTTDLHGVDRVLALVESYAGPVALESFDGAVLARCRDAACPIGLVGPGDDALASLPRCDFLSWNVDRLDDRPSPLPVTTWTVRDRHQASKARAAGAQIVFEGWRP